MRYSEILESIQAKKLVEALDSKKYLQAAFDNRDSWKKTFDAFCGVWQPQYTQRMLSTYNLWNIGADPHADNVFLVTGLNLETKKIEQWAFYKNDQDAEDTGDDVNQMAKNLRMTGMVYELANDLIEYFTDKPGDYENDEVDEGTEDLDSTSLDDSTVLDEARNFDWYILPATMALYGARVVDIYKAISEWGTGTIYVCSKVESKAGGDKERMLFVASSGKPYYQVGQEYHAGHDQTGTSKGFYKVINRVYFENNEIVSKDNDLGLTGKASVAVFK